jgi:hypothetical protein
MNHINELLQNFAKVMEKTFLAEDRNSNFPKESTICETYESHPETGKNS